MKTKNLIKKAMLIYLYSIASFSNAQLKVLSSGQIGLGTTSPLYPFHVVSSFALFTSQANGLPQSAALIRGNSVYSLPNSPDYTWQGDYYTGICHPAAGIMKFCSSGYELAGISYTGPYQFWCYGNTFAANAWTISDRRYKRNINTLESSLSKVLKLRGVSYEYNREEFKQFNFNEGQNVGLIAQELQEILPEAVKSDEKGYLAVNYNAIVPLLIEAIKEQQKQIEALNQQTNTSNLKTSSSNNSSITGTDGSIGIDRATLYQNAPNPFNSETVIKYYIPNGAKSANIYVYDINGNKKKSFNITERGEGSIKIAANELGQGIYFYSMVLDGIVQDSKTMLITE